MKLLQVAGVLLAVGAVAAGCGHRAASSPAPASTPEPGPTSSTPAAAPRGTPVPRTPAGSGSDGLTIRYAGSDGSIQTLRVEDFRR